MTSPQPISCPTDQSAPPGSTQTRPNGQAVARGRASRSGRFAARLDPTRPIRTASFACTSVGRSSKGRPLFLYTFGRPDRALLVLAGTHGDEPKSVFIARRLIEQLDARLAATRANAPQADPARLVPLNLAVCPLVNPDGYIRRTRKNAPRVDLNRNFPTENWTPSPKRSRRHGGPRPASEPETQAVIRLVDDLNPALIVTIHSIDDHRFCNNFDGPAARAARLLAKHNRYPVRASIGYPTPGSFGTWAGIERNIPTITLELPAHHSPQRCASDNIAGIERLAADAAAD